MIKVMYLVVVVITTAVICSFWHIEKECIKPEPYQQNQMVDGCVMQKSGGTWIKTCG